MRKKKWQESETLKVEEEAESLPGMLCSLCLEAWAWTDDSSPGRHQTWSELHPHHQEAELLKDCFKCGEQSMENPKQQRMDGAFVECLLRACLRLLMLSILFNPHDNRRIYIQITGPGHGLGSALLLTLSPCSLCSSPTGLLAVPLLSPAHSCLRAFALAVPTPLPVLLPNSHIFLTPSFPSGLCLNVNISPRLSLSNMLDCSLLIMFANCLFLPARMYVDCLFCSLPRSEAKTGTRDSSLGVKF